jgi:hypothetical protein
LELYFGSNALLSSIAWKGETIIRGGYPDIALKGWVPVQAKPEEGSLPDYNPKESIQTIKWKGSSVWTSDKVNPGPFLRDRYSISATFAKDGSVILEIVDSFNVLADVQLEMWRNFVFLPVEAWKGRSVTCQKEKINDTESFILPIEKTPGDLAYGKVLTLSGNGFLVEIRSDDAHGLVDHRQWGTDDYLWASYPAPKDPKKGTSYSTRFVIRIVPTR